MGRIVLVGSFDTKSEPLGLLIEELSAAGQLPITIDTGVFGGEHGCDYSAAVVAEAGGGEIATLAGLGRAAAVNVMAEGAGRILQEIGGKGAVDALVCMGGSNAATVFSKLTGALPIGVPKILMASVVAGETRPLVNASDVILLYPIVDIEGNNSLLRGMISRLASVAAAATRSKQLMRGEDAVHSIGLTMFGVTTACVSKCRSLLAPHGIESFVFHANGSGGKSLERFVAQSLVSSLIDVTITELADALFGGLLPAGPDRLRTAAKCGMAQVIAPGAIDMINFGPMGSVPERFRGRKLLAHNDLVTLVRTTPQENAEMGRSVAERLGDTSAPTVILIPRQGFSALDRKDGPFFDPQATDAFTEALRSSASPSVRVMEMDCHINDQEFAEALVTQSLEGRAENRYRTT